MQNKYLSALLLTLALPFLGFATSLSAQETEREVNVYFFWGDGCSHCETKKPFLEDLQKRYAVNIHSFEVWNSSDHRTLFVQVGRALRADVTGVPFTVIGEQYFVGYLSDQTTGKQMEEAIVACLQNGCNDIAGRMINPDGAAPPAPPEEKPSSEPETLIDQPTEEDVDHPITDSADTEEQKISVLPDMLTLPFLGDVQTKNLSLPIFTIIIAALDGFNPCAMWTLLFLISLLLGMKDKKRMWILGTAFIMASAAVYFLFLSAWLNLLLFIGFILWVRLGIGLVALGGGGYYLKEYFFNPHGGCKVTGSKKRQKVFARMKEITQNSHFLLALGGIILLAVAVNLVELICSAGLPAVYTQVLTLSALPTWQYYLYLLLYIFIFMLDDLFIFFSAMITLQMTGLSDKYARLSHLIGGTIMLLIGLLLIFKPEWLMFG